MQYNGTLANFFKHPFLRMLIGIGMHFFKLPFQPAAMFDSIGR